MPIKFINKLIAVSLFSLTLLPAQFAQAAVTLANPDELIKNVEHAQSVDFSVDVDVATTNSQTARSSTVHIDLDGVADANHRSAVNANFSSTYNGKTESHLSSVVLTPEALYFSEDGIWYVIEQGPYTDLPTEKEVADSAANFKSYMQDMFNRGVITYQMESVDYVNGKMAVRYGYTVNYNKFVDYLLEKKAITSYQAQDAKASAQGIIINGQFWVDTAAMLPVKLTFNVNGTSGSECGDLKVVISFNSFNQPVNVTEPKNAISFEQYHAPAPKPVVTSMTVTITPNADTDSDGLTDADEKAIWKTNPTSSDTDGDGYADKTEVINGYNPNGPGKLDSDNDGLTDYSELTVYRSDRYNSDSDGDSYPDGLEVANGYNPLGFGRM